MAEFADLWARRGAVLEDLRRAKECVDPSSVQESEDSPHRRRDGASDAPRAGGGTAATRGALNDSVADRRRRAPVHARPGSFRAPALVRRCFVLLDAAAARPRESRAATLIQRHFRGAVVRERVLHLAEAAREIQRIFRGFVGRSRIRQEEECREEARRLARLSYFATAIQAAFRGFYSRRYRHDCAARRRYLETVRSRGDGVRAALDEHHEALVRRKEEEDEAKARAEFARLTQNLHHLVSTKAQPGVFRPRYATREEDLPSAFNVPVEEHLRAGSRAFLRTQGYNKDLWPATLTRNQLQAKLALRDVGGTAAVAAADPASAATLEGIGTWGASAAAGSTRSRAEDAALPAAGGAHASGALPSSALPGVPRPALAPGTPDRLVATSRSARFRAAEPPSYSDAAGKSLRTAAPYGAEVEALRQEKRYERLRELDPRPFSTGKPKEPPRELGIHAAEPYIPAWKRALIDREREHSPDQKERRVSDANFRTALPSGGVFEEYERERTRTRVAAGMRALQSLGPAGTAGAPSAALAPAAAAPIRTGGMRR